jgi:hypothetical protein
LTLLMKSRANTIVRLYLWGSSAIAYDAEASPRTQGTLRCGAEKTFT